MAGSGVELSALMTPLNPGRLEAEEMQMVYCLQLNPLNGPL